MLLNKCTQRRGVLIFRGGLGEAVQQAMQGSVAGGVGMQIRLRQLGGGPGNLAEIAEPKGAADHYPGPKRAPNPPSPGPVVARDYQQARQLHDDALARSRRVLARDHPTTLVSALVLGVVGWSLGEYRGPDTSRMTSSLAAARFWARTTSLY